jgi:hypothetical protein
MIDLIFRPTATSRPNQSDRGIELSDSCRDRIALRLQGRGVSGRDLDVVSDP